MIAVKTLRAILKAFPGVEADNVKLFRTEAELSQVIKDLSGWLLVAIVPSSDTQAISNNNVFENEQAIVYIIQKIDHKDQDEEDAINGIEDAQQKIFDLKMYLYEIATNCGHVFHPWLKQLELNTLHTDPEYNFLGCDGYSLSFVIKTNWF